MHLFDDWLAASIARFVFTVKDTGVGMEQWKVQSLFNAFEQADTSTTRRFGGLGLGLTITSKITEKMSGKIAVLSEPGKGSSFSVMLPLSLPESITPKKVEEVSPLWIREPMVLVAEDNKMNQMVLRMLLEESQLNIEFANDGLEACDKFKNKNYDLVFMDIQMPNMNGYDAMNEPFYSAHVVRMLCMSCL